MPAEIKRGKKQEKAKFWNNKMDVTFDLEKIEQF